MKIHTVCEITHFSLNYILLACNMKTRITWKILHLTEFFYTTSGCDGCDIYQVWVLRQMGKSYHHYSECIQQSDEIAINMTTIINIIISGQIDQHLFPFLLWKQKLLRFCSLWICRWGASNGKKLLDPHDHWAIDWKLHYTSIWKLTNYRPPLKSVSE